MPTLTFEILAPFTVQQHGRVTTWQPGQRMILSPEHARRVLARVREKVRLLDGDLVGQIVTWESPLFGLLQATVLATVPDGVRVIHPLTEVKCVIPVTWLRVTPMPDETADLKKETERPT